MEEVLKDTQTIIHTMGHSKMERLMEKESILGVTVKSMMVNGIKA